MRAVHPNPSRGLESIFPRAIGKTLPPMEALIAAPRFLLRYWAVAVMHGAMANSIMSSMCDGAGACHLVRVRLRLGMCI